MESIFSGFVIDPAKCSELSLEEKRELVYEICRWTDNAPEILQSWSRRELLQLICAEMGKERKYTGVTKPKMIEHLLRLVSQRNGKRKDGNTSVQSSSLNNQNGRKKRNKESGLPTATDLNCDSVKSKDRADVLICKNVACRAALNAGNRYCKRCSCCICFRYDDNKDPSLWLVCSSDPPYHSSSCGVSCHLKCALKHEKSGIWKHGSNPKLDGSFYCICCGKVNWLIRSWRKQLVIAKDARRVDVLCDRLSLIDKMLKGTELYKDLENIVGSAVKKLKKEVGPLDKVSAIMARGIVNRLNCSVDVQKLCSTAIEALDFVINCTPELNADNQLIVPGPDPFQIHFEEVSPCSVVVSLQSIDNLFDENIFGCSLWHRPSNSAGYSEEPTCLILRPDTRVVITGLSPSTEYSFKVSPFSSTKVLGQWEARCSTESLNSSDVQCSTPNSKSTCIHGDFILALKKEQDAGEQPRNIQGGSQKGSTNTSDNNPTLKLPKLGPANAHDKHLRSEGTSDNDENHSALPSDIVPFVSSNSCPVETPCKPDPLNGTPDSSHKKDMEEQQYEYCVKVIRWLECEGHMEKELRVKFLTWFSLKATAQERRVVSAFIDVLIDDPASLVAQLIDAFMDGICSKGKRAIQKGFCTSLWH